MTPTAPTAAPATNAPMTAPPAPVPPLPIVIKGERGEVRIPPDVGDLDSFVRWCHSDTFPEHARISFLAGVLWVDLNMEQAFWHNDVKSEVTTVLRPLVRAAGLGRYFSDGMRLRNLTANLSTDPDGMFYLHTSLQSGQIQEVAGRPGGVVEYVGTPDMVLEVVRESSVEKDTVRLPGLYQAAQIREFWRIDVRAQFQFEILRLTPAGYAATQLADGWWRSDVFAHDFRLIQNNDQLGRPEFRLEVR